MSDDKFPIPLPESEQPVEAAVATGDVHIDDLELSIRSHNVLLNLGITHLSQLSRMTESEYLKTKNTGRKSLKEMVEVLAEHGLTFGMKD